MIRPQTLSHTIVRIEEIQATDEQPIGVKEGIYEGYWLPSGVIRIPHENVMLEFKEDSELITIGSINPIHEYNLGARSIYMSHLERKLIKL